MNLQEAVDLYLPQVEAELRDVVRPSDPSQEPYYGMMRYHLGWTDEALRPTEANRGKRLRPLVCLLCCQAAGGDPRLALPAACAVELVHNFSLVHDDIQDASRLRRGRRAVWDIWGVAHGLNVGDGLFVLARLALYRLEAMGVPPRRRLAAAQALDQACLALCEGQYLDMTFESRPDVTVAEYLAMIRLKTAALLATSAQLGAILAASDRQAAALWYRFGQDLGMAFQIQDDILGIWGDEQITGKSAATDLQAKKKTLPVVYALALGEGQLARLYARDQTLDDEGIRLAVAALDSAGARQVAEEKAEEHYRLALHSLSQADGRSEALSALRELADSLLARRA